MTMTTLRNRGTHELGGNFFDYQNDEEAIIHEKDIVEAMAERGYPYYSDPSFPASGDSLYRTPQQPPAGAMPPSLVAWGRLSRQEVRRCHTPLTFPAEGETLSPVLQGALGDSWLVSALNIHLSSSDVLRRLLVSDRHRDKGVYTVKLFKEGSWRYLHIDDRIPCHPSRAPLFCKSRDPNQIWATLIEKAVAKLHGCYETLGLGSIEQGLRCLSGAPLVKTPLVAAAASGSSAGGAGAGVKTADDAQEELWSNAKRWTRRGCVMGCYRSLSHDRACRRQVAADAADNNYTSSIGNNRGHRQDCGLMAGRGYGVLRAVEVSADATPTHDSVTLRMVELSCPWDAGQWRGAWSRDSAKWEQYPSVRAQLRPNMASSAGKRGNGVGEGGEGQGRDGAGRENGAAEVTRGESFWMSLDDFSHEFSQLFTCVSFSAAQMTSGLNYKSYRGFWIPGDPLSGSGGGFKCRAFLQNPFYPVTVQRNFTTFSVCLSTKDRSWQMDPMGVGTFPAIGYYILKLTGTKPRVTKLRSRKVIARSNVFTLGCQVAGEHMLDSGRYAVVPTTVRPLSFADGFVLELTADKIVEYEQTDDNIPDLDHELQMSDDEGEEPSKAMSGGMLVESVEAEDMDLSHGDKVAEAMHEEIADLSKLVSQLSEDFRQLVRQVSEQQ